jgi:collagenase-like PrtC family protease
MTRPELKPPLSVPSNLQPDLLDRLDLSRVGELYGQAKDDPLGGGRSSLIVPNVSLRQARRHIREVRDRGLSFNYLLNTTCLDNLEFTRAGRAMIERAIRFAADSGADRVSVSIPHLLELVKRLAPSLKVSVSTMAGVDSPEMAAQFERLGADRITLSVTDVNRDFRRLREIRARFSGELQILANLECLRGCPYTRYHANLNSHASQAWHPSGGLVVDYCFLSCSMLRLEEPGHLMMAGWIRPEDQHYYAAAGIDSLKLVNRTMTSERIAAIVQAYTRGRHEGNLLDLFSHSTATLAYKEKDLVRALKHLFKPARINVFKLAKYKDLFAWPAPFIDNGSLDGFLDFFVEGRCRPEGCGRQCRYCFDWAAKVVEMDEEVRRPALERLKEFKRLLMSGELFEYV